MIFVAAIERIRPRAMRAVPCTGCVLTFFVVVIAARPIPRRCCTPDFCYARRVLQGARCCCLRFKAHASFMPGSTYFYPPPANYQLRLRSEYRTHTVELHLALRRAPLARPLADMRRER